MSNWNRMFCSHRRTAWEDGATAEFRRRVLDLIEAGRPITDIARDLMSMGG